MNEVSSSMLPSDWQCVPFAKAVVPPPIPTKKKIFARDYLAVGRYPVVDQGAGFLAGWTDDDAAVIAQGLPYIVFGDHTRVFKYVDQPFALGADGTQLLKPASEFDPRFFYYACRSLDIPSRGYNRHFRLLKERKLVRPPLPEQRGIAALLREVERAITLDEQLIATTSELKRVMMHELFTRGTRTESSKETEIGPVPRSWEVLPLESSCSFASGGTPSKQEPAFWAGPIPWASPKDLKRARLSDTLDHISEAGLQAGSRLAPAGALLVVIRGMILAKDVPVALTEVPLAFNQDLKAVIPGECLSPAFLLYAVQAHRHRLFQKVGRSAHGTRTLLSGDLASFLIPIPTAEEQSEITAVLEAIDSRLHCLARKTAALRELLDTLTPELMTGRLRVDDLDLTSLDDRDGNETRAKHRTTMRLRLLDQQDNHSDDDAAHLAPEQRLAMMWQLTRDAWAFTRHPERAESRLQRHVVRAHRRER